MNPTDTTDIERRFAALEARALRGERRLRAACSAALLGAVAAFTLGQHKEAAAQGYTVTLAQLAARMTAVEAKTQDMTRVSDPAGNPVVRFTAVNVQIVNGRGGTFSSNGAGNLIVGYNEASQTAGDDRGGSHNLVVGAYHDYTSYAGLVAGNQNRVTAPGASVSGGENNTAGGTYASVSGGAYNIAFGNAGSVSGGLSRGVFSNYYWAAGELYQAY